VTLSTPLLRTLATVPASSYPYNAPPAVLAEDYRELMRLRLIDPDWQVTPEGRDVLAANRERIEEEC
jgi:hypothetical protein